MSNAAPAPPAAAGVKPPSVYTNCIRLQPHVPCSKYGGLAPSMVWRYLEKHGVRVRHFLTLYRLHTTIFDTI